MLVGVIVELVFLDGAVQLTIVDVHRISTMNKMNNFFKVFSPTNYIFVVYE